MEADVGLQGSHYREWHWDRDAAKNKSRANGSADFLFCPGLTGILLLFDLCDLAVAWPPDSSGQLLLSGFSILCIPFVAGLSRRSYFDPFGILHLFGGVDFSGGLLHAAGSWKPFRLSRNRAVAVCLL